MKKFRDINVWQKKIIWIIALSLILYLVIRANGFPTPLQVPERQELGSVVQSSPPITISSPRFLFVENVAYGEGAGQLFDLYLPVSEDRVPLYVYCFHAWCSSDCKSVETMDSRHSPGFCSSGTSPILS